MGFNEIKEKMIEIAEVLKLFPDSLQENVFNVFVNSLEIDMGEKESNELEELINYETDEEFKKVQQNNDTSDTGTKQLKSTVKSKRKTNNKSESYQQNKNLNLIPKGNQSFKEFYDLKKPISSKDFNIVAVYYLEKILGRNEITIEDIYTCYKQSLHKMPKRLKQSLADTSSKSGLINIQNNLYSIPLLGENYIEHNLPKLKNK
ncbi:hypothetical protein MKY83_19265 [Bacillus sp. FSL M8-0266]|uniref:hypothetical protein n=1 Tax=Bacillus TaxID=1386 RepID=UPI00315837D0